MLELNIEIFLNRYHELYLKIKNQQEITNKKLKIKKELNVDNLLFEIFGDELKQYNQLNVIFNFELENLFFNIDKILFPYFLNLNILFKNDFGGALDLILKKGIYNKIVIKNNSDKTKLNLFFTDIKIRKELNLKRICIYDKLLLENLDNLELSDCYFFNIKLKNLKNINIFSSKGFRLETQNHINFNINNSNIDNFIWSNFANNNNNIDNNIINNIINTDFGYLEIKELDNHIIDIKYSNIVEMFVDNIYILNLDNTEVKKINIIKSKKVYLINIKFLNCNIENSKYLKIENINQLNKKEKFKIKNIKTLEMEINQDFNFFNYKMLNIEMLYLNVNSGFVDIKKNIFFNKCFLNNLIDYLININKKKFKIKLNINKKFKYYDINILNIINILEKLFNKKNKIDLNKIYMIYSLYINKISYQTICKNNYPETVDILKLEKFKRKTFNKLNEL